jgi:hypothetical protein
MRRSIVAIGALVCTVALVGAVAYVGAVALAQTITPPPVARTFKPPAKSPVTFVKVRSAEGFSRALARAHR